MVAKSIKPETIKFSSYDKEEILEALDNLEGYTVVEKPFSFAGKTTAKVVKDFEEE